MALEYDRYCEEIVAQTELLWSEIADRDLTTPVPSCPGWNVGQLVRHLGGGQRWAAAAVAAQAHDPFPEDGFAMRDLSAFIAEDPATLGPWLADGAEALASALRATGAGVAMWTPVPSTPTTDFFARRFAHETLMHRADATLALGDEFDGDPVVVADAIDEWFELGSLPVMFEYNPEMRELLGPERTVHLHATDTAPDLQAEWFLDLTGDRIVWRRAHERAAVAVRGPIVDLLLLIYRRRPVAAPLDVVGDDELLQFWLDRVGFG